MKLFRKHVSPACEYCACARPLSNGIVFCMRKGPVQIYDKCGRFRYDPLKRVPEVVPVSAPTEYREEDFTL